MNSKLSISNWFLREDEEFWAAVKNEHQRIGLLSQLYRVRVFNLSAMFVFMIFAFIAMIKAPNVAVLGLLGIVSTMLNYLDANSKVRTIKLYELFSEAQRK